MDQYTQAKELKKMIRLVVEEVVGDLTRSCFRCYKATVVKPPYQDPVFGNVCKIKLVGDSQVIAVAYTSQMQYMQTGDVVWVATFYNSFRNAIVWQNVFFNNGELNVLGNEVSEQGDQLGTLEGTVTQQGQTITQQGTAIGQLQTDLNDKASQGSVDNLQEQVNSQGHIITEQTSEIDWLNYLIEETQTELQKLKDFVESGSDTP